MKTITKQCIFCQEPFEASIREHNRGNAIFCSIAHARQYAAQKKREQRAMNVICAYCNKPFYKNLSKQTNSKSGLFFCCREHKDLAQRIGGIQEIQPPHYGTSPASHSYRKKAFDAYPAKCNHCGYNELPDILVVHHKDRNRKNVTSENLEILCPNCHAKEHFLHNDGIWSYSHTKI